MTSQEIRTKFLDFFKSKGHEVIPSAPLVPEHDPTVLFTTAGMHPLVPFLMGAEHPRGKRLTNAQKCLRTGDIDEVGDERHNTFFEMLGNWSLGDYFKKEAIEWSFEFLTSKEWIGFDPKKLYVTVFEGDKDALRDDESIAIWQDVFKSAGIDAKVGERVFLYPKKKNWWGPAGQTGPCGPDTEMFYDTRPNFPLEISGGQAGNPHDPKIFGQRCHPNCDCGRFLEIWNDVFMQYNKNADGTYTPLAQKNVDTGMGLERMAKILQNKDSVYETDLFSAIIEKLKLISGKSYQDDVRSFRIIADHLRAATFLTADGVLPSNVERGYILRRLIRRAIRFGKMIGIEKAFIAEIGFVVIQKFGETYPELFRQQNAVIDALSAEEEKFQRTLVKGLKEFDHLIEHQGTLTGKDAFDLYQTFGFPLEMTIELAKEKNLEISESQFADEFQKHQELSRAGSTQKFKGGLADHSEIATRYHTATHLLHQVLRDVLGDHVFQKGSNITAERMRFDFSHSKKMTPEEIKRAEDLVNQKINEDLPVHKMTMKAEEAKKLGAIGLFEGKYGDTVSVYKIGDYSKEFCGGPHVEHTGTIGPFRILKEEAVSAGVRRIKAVVEADKK